MNTSKYRFSLEVQESQSNVCLDVKRGDTKSRTLLITLTDGGFPYHISDECYAVFAATKPDGKKVFNDCVIEDDTIIYELTPQTTAAAGCAECEIRLYGADDKLLTSPGFLIAVHDTTFHDGDVVESETETNTLNRLISDAVEEYMDENDVGGGSGGLTVYTLSEGESVDDAPADADIIHDPYTEPEASGGGLVVYTLSEGETVDDAPADADIIHDPYEEPEIPEADISLNVEGASVGQIVKVAAVDEAGKPTAWEAVEMPRGGNEWVKLGDSTVHDTYEFIPTSFTGGVVTIDPNSEGYEYIIGRSATMCVVHPINIALKETAVVGVLKPKDANAGTFDFYDRDGNPKTNAAYDPAKYKISVINVASIAFQNVENYQRYKLRVTSPVISTNGLRPFFVSSMTGLSLGACVNALKTGGVIIEREFYQFPGDENYMYVRTCISHGVFYGGTSANEMQSIEIIATGEGKTKPPLNKEVSFTVSNMIFVNGTRFELWGANDA